MKNLPPSYFALVMATGIVSIAAQGFELRLFASTLFVINILAYAVLIALTLLRSVVYPRRVLADMIDHRIGTGFFATVAATCIVGVQFLSIARSVAVAAAFLAGGVALWTALTYAIFAAYTVKRDKPSLEHGLTSLWLVAVVATQSIAVLGALVAREWSEPARTVLNFLAVSVWLWGGMLYVWIITLIFYRWVFLPFAASDFDPASWITMGAMAISTLAGAELTQNASDTRFLAELLPLLKGFTLFHWATGTWWIPMLLALSAWRQFAYRAPLRYDSAWWAAVFPLGMYCEATRQMAAAFDLGFLDFLTRIMFVAAATAWTFAFAGLLWSLRNVLPASAK